ncbi:hypothetical protein MUN78_07030 [Leucobacter allii]|uniref:Excisionase n=1 Tax=Leucobacter allii TaxID=2932247 RepID=A0ABY4FQN0_9MICO|nr:hypothetical protein [Leucobacter allii]UOQ58570.1 hypothetical protein MUN78_07030 [Leucobacter allii]
MVEVEQEPERWFTYRGAALRVDRSVRSIKQWRKDGMPMGWDELGRRIVREDVLLAELRRRLAANPAHQYRIRAALGDTPTEGWS